MVVLCLWGLSSEVDMGILAWGSSSITSWFPKKWESFSISFKSRLRNWKTLNFVLFLVARIAIILNLSFAVCGMKFRLLIPYFKATATWCKHTLPFIPCSLGICMYMQIPREQCLFLFYVGYLKLVWIFLMHGYAAHTDKTCISSQATGSKVQILWLSKCHGEKRVIKVHF